MNHQATAEFRSSYDSLPESVRSLADADFELLKANPRHPSLHLKESVDSGLSAWACVTGSLAVRDSETLLWFWIGTHGQYDKIVHRK